MFSYEGITPPPSHTTRLPPAAGTAVPFNV